MTKDEKPKPAASPQPPASAEYCDIQQAAAFFRELGLTVSHHTIRRWWWNGEMKFPHPLAVGGKHVWSKARLRKWLETRPVAKPRKREAANAA